MTLKQFLTSEQTKLFSSFTRVYIEGHRGCEYYTLKFDNGVYIDDALTKLNEQTLSKEVALVTFQEEAVVIHFKED